MLWLPQQFLLGPDSAEIVTVTRGKNHTFAEKVTLVRKKSHIMRKKSHFRGNSHNEKVTLSTEKSK